MTSTPVSTIAEDEIRRLRRAVGELTLLNELARAVSSTNDVDEIIAMIVTRATQAIAAEEVVLTLVDRSEMTPAGTVFRKVDADQSSHFHLTRNLLGCMCHERRALIINDAPNDPRLHGVPLAPGVRNLLCVPLTIGAELIAVISACNKLDEADFLADDQRLLTIIASQSAQVLERARLLKEQAANAQLRQDLLVATSIQTGLLPAAPPPIAGYELAGISIPARQVGGDYYDYIPLGPDLWGIVLGDVSGKGIPAALLMSNLQAMLRGQAPQEAVCRRFVRWCNHQFYLCTPHDKFATLFYGVLDTSRHVFTYCNAGHERPYLFSSGRPPRRLCTGGLAVGVLEEAEYLDEAVALVPGDMLVVFSDGVTDVENDFGEPFGEDRLLPILNQAVGLATAEVIAKVKDALKAFAGQQPAFDDLTMVVVKRVK